MRKQTLALGFIACLIMGLTAFMSLKVYAAVTATNILPVMHEDVRDYTLVYIQVFSMDGTQVYSESADAMTAIGPATYTDTDIPVTVDGDFYVGPLPFPTNLPRDSYIVRQMGSADATADKDDTVIGSPIVVSWSGTGLSTPPKTLPVSF